MAERLLAGAHPCTATPAGTTASTALAEIGATLFVDLTEEGELPPYAQALGAARHARRPIPDMGAPSRAEMAATLDLVDEELSRGGVVYVHCFGGIGRTGTVVGCWLRRHGRDTGDPVADIAVLRRGVATRRMRSPETAEQRRMVRSWARGD